MTQTDADPIEQSAQPPKPVAVAVVLGAAGLGLSAVAGLWLAMLATGRVLWPSLGFEIVVVVAVVLAVFAARGRFARGYGVTLLSFAGVALISAVFGLHLAARPTLASAVRDGAASEAAKSVLNGVILARIGLAGWFGALAVLAVLVRSRRTWRPLVQGLALVIPAAALSWWAIDGGAGRLIGSIESAMGVARLVASILVGLVVIVVLGIGGHLLIRAFELSRTEED